MSLQKWFKINEIAYQCEAFILTYHAKESQQRLRPQQKSFSHIKFIKDGLN